MEDRKKKSDVDDLAISEESPGVDEYDETDSEDQSFCNGPERVQMPTQLPRQFLWKYLAENIFENILKIDKRNLFGNETFSTMSFLKWK